MPNLIHDIKTERQSVSAGLPALYKVVPIAFYAVTLGSILLSGLFWLNLRRSETRTEELSSRVSAAQLEQTNLLSQQSTIVDESKEAEGIAEWLEGSRPLQAITVAVGRSMASDATIAELALNRNPEIPAHTFMQFKIDNASAEQIEQSLAAIYALKYQTYSAQQVKGRNAIDFQATLIFDEK
ncbi:MAG: hypothetical protein AAF357_03665 [Verrucomicrobiota bacterium]